MTKFLMSVIKKVTREKNWHGPDKFTRREVHDKFSQTDRTLYKYLESASIIFENSHLILF